MSTTDAAVRDDAQFRGTHSDEVLVEVKDLKMFFPVTEGILIHRVVAHVKAVNGVSFQIKKGETLGLVGESGCGKTTTGRCMIQLEQATSGEILYQGTDLTKLDSQEMIDFRKKIQIIFQDPFSSVNPRMTIGDIIAEPMKVHGIIEDPTERRQRVLELLTKCGLKENLSLIHI